MELLDIQKGLFGNIYVINLILPLSSSFSKPVILLIFRKDFLSYQFSRHIANTKQFRSKLVYLLMLPKLEIACIKLN